MDERRVQAWVRQRAHRVYAVALTPETWRAVWWCFFHEVALYAELEDEWVRESASLGDKVEGLP